MIIQLIYNQMTSNIKGGSTPFFYLYNVVDLSTTFDLQYGIIGVDKNERGGKMRSKLKLSIMSLSLILLILSLSGCTKIHDMAPLPRDDTQLISPNPVIG